MRAYIYGVMEDSVVCLCILDLLYDALERSFIKNLKFTLYRNGYLTSEISSPENAI